MTFAQPTIQFNLDFDIRIASEMAAGLVPYVYGTELYGPMPNTMPRLTVGGLLMRLHRLNAISTILSPDQRARVTEAQTTFEKARSEWTVAYEGKLDREITARLQALGGLLNECQDDPRRGAEVYPSEIEKRVMLELLTSEAKALKVLTDAQEANLKGFDGALRRYVAPAGFIWDKRLEPAYPSEKFWYLYQAIRRSDSRG